MRVIRDDFGDVVIHLNTFLRPNHAEEYPRPDQHNGDTNKCEDVVHTRPRTAGVHHFSFHIMIRCCMQITTLLDAKNTKHTSGMFALRILQRLFRLVVGSWQWIIWLNESSRRSLVGERRFRHPANVLVDSFCLRQGRQERGEEQALSVLPACTFRDMPDHTLGTCPFGTEQLNGRCVICHILWRQIPNTASPVTKISRKDHSDCSVFTPVRISYLFASCHLDKMK